MGDIVVTRKTTGGGSKLSPPFDRRGKIIKVNSSPSYRSPLSYKIRLQNNKTTTRHIKDLKLAQSGSFGGHQVIKNFGEFETSKQQEHTTMVEEEESKEMNIRETAWEEKGEPSRKDLDAQFTHSGGDKVVLRRSQRLRDRKQS